MTDIDIDAIREELRMHADATGAGRAYRSRTLADYVPALLAKVDELTVELAEVREQAEDSAYAASQARKALIRTREVLAERDAQLVTANRRAQGLEADLRSANTANTAYANENARLRSQLADADVVIGSMRVAIDEADEAVAR